MTNIAQKNTKQSMQLHIDKAYDIIKDSLPDNYANRVLEKLKDDTTLTTGIVRNIKKRITSYPSSRINVLNALVEVAKEYQKELELLKDNVKG